MMAEVVIFVPTMARYSWDYLNDKLATAHLVLTALDVAADETGRIDPLLRDNLLSQGRILGMSVQRPSLPPGTLGPAIPSRIRYAHDLRSDAFWDLAVYVIKTTERPRTYAISVTGVSPSNPAVLMDVIFYERQLRRELWGFATRIFFISLFISMITAGLVYAPIQWLAARPLRRLMLSMTCFQNTPEDSRNVISPSTRKDKTGISEQALGSMQQEPHTALLQKERLAGVGTTVTKISNDLKNILATAMLESERLAVLTDPEVERLTAGMVRAVDRAVSLSASTLRFSKEGLPHVSKQPLRTVALLEDLKTHIKPALKTAAIKIARNLDAPFAGGIDLLRRAFENLLCNADEAGAVSIELIALEDGGYQTIRVTDNGSGLMPKARDNLFAPFSGSARAGGCGLGLPIVRELLRAQCGDVTLLSTGPQGACFVVRLPL